MHIEVLGQGLDPVFFVLHHLQDLRLPAHPFLDFFARHDALAYDFFPTFVHEESHTDKSLGEPAGPVLADGEVHDSEVLRQELLFGKADLGQPGALGVVSCLVDPDLLGWIREFDDVFLDQAHLRRRNVRSSSPLFQRQRGSSTVIPKADVNLSGQRSSLVNLGYPSRTIYFFPSIFKIKIICALAMEKSVHSIHPIATNTSRTHIEKNSPVSTPVSAA